MARRSTTFSRLSLLGMIIVLIPLGYGVYRLFHDLEAPDVSLSHMADRISPSVPVVVTARDAASGIKSISVEVRYQEQTIQIAEQKFSDGMQSQQLIFTLDAANLPDGAVFDLEVSARDTSFGGFGFGNKKTLILPLRLDRILPRASVKTSAPVIFKGGSACIVYSLSKEVQQTGVRAGDLFFPAFRQNNGDYICFFAFPYNVDIKNYTPQLFALDISGNVLSQDLAINRKNRVFKTDTLNISQSFLDLKSAEFSALVPGAMSDIDRFLQINGPIRRANSAALLQIGRDTVNAMLWKGSFLRLPKAASRAGFADHRTYLWQGQKVDEQTHLGFDLASVRQAEVPAANSGRIIFADYLGIYGYLIVIDHGMGLQSIYSHLSEIGVSVGQSVERGQVIGRTGATGMAGGDHLHFGILISGLEVTPLEWLDSRWIKHNISDRINDAGGKAPDVTVEAQDEAADSPKPAKKPASKRNRR